MKFLSFNVNGIRAAISKGLLDFLSNSRVDIILLQETKVSAPVSIYMPQYFSAWSFSDRGGYAGVAILFKRKPINIINGFFDKNFNADGRVITLEYPSFFVVNVYVPNSQGALDRWYHRLDFDSALLHYLSELSARKCVIVGGDFNVAHNYIDIYPENTKNIETQAGFREEERGGFDNLLESGFVDAFRFLHPKQCAAYTWWSGKFRNRDNNRGRRIDYFLVSDELKSKILDSMILAEISISDHAPIMLTMNL